MKLEPETFASLARKSLIFRRSALRVAWRAAALAGKLPDYGLAPLFMDCLRLPGVEARRVDREAVYHDWLASLEWLALLNRSTAQLHEDMGRVVLDGEETIAHLAASGRPMIFAPLHMGCYALAFGALMSRHFSGRRMLILRARDDREIETRVMRRVSETGVDMRFLKVADKADYVEAVRFARGGAVIVSFVDLPPTYGGPVDIDLFGRPAALAMGVDALARVADAVVAPIAVSSTPRGDTVHLGIPFEVQGSGEAERQRVARFLQRHIETEVAAYPAQWHMWSRLHEFARAPSAEQGAAAKATAAASAGKAA